MLRLDHKAVFRFSLDALEFSAVSQLKDLI